ncbi:MAG: cyclase family protein [Spirochaetes bacterium]|nr:cyclase family protein [Spirochaetota bacterium]
MKIDFTKIIDLSIDLSADMVSWPGDPLFRTGQEYSIRNGDKANVLAIQSGSHSGTHIDAPYHCLSNGRTIDKINMTDLIGPCLVLQVRGLSITKKDLEGIRKGQYKRAIFKTENTKKRLLWKKKFDPDYVFLSLEAAKECISKGIKVIGIDYLSIEKYKSDGKVHDHLLKNGVIIIEGLDLRRVREKEYFLMAMPLKIRKGDGAPSRVVLADIKK